MISIMPDESRAIRHGTTVAVLLVAIIAAIVSFIHIDHLAVTHGQTSLAAYLLPVSIDGTVAASSLVCCARHASACRHQHSPASCSACR